MKAEEIRALGPDEIRARLDEAREGYFKLRFQFSTGQLKDTARLRRARREVARLATILQERQAGVEAEGRQA
ncbi:MAG TPA: 50S ribosomal protein L29 [Anaerolineales bacterium]|nr:50S ribosomal protein L29 [Anaerolineales bacterium]